MNLSKLFEIQAKLDARIEREHPRRDGEDRLAKKILALQVELGELANEWRGFKFWSEKQEPKHGYQALIDCPKCSGNGFWFSGNRVWCKNCNETGKIANPLFEKYVNCLHFILSIGLELKVENNSTPYTYTTDNITRQFNVIFQDLAKLDIIINDEISSKANTRIQYFELFADVLGICEILGFSWEDVERVYIEKNEVNHQRQVTERRNY